MSVGPIPAETLHMDTVSQNVSTYDQHISGLSKTRATEKKTPFYCDSIAVTPVTQKEQLLDSLGQEVEAAWSGGD